MLWGTLQPGDQEPVVDVQTLIEDVYQRSGYDHFLNYRDDLDCALSQDDQEWLNGVLTGLSD